MIKKLITKYVSNMLCLRVEDESREVAWSTLTNIGAKVSRCSLMLSRHFIVDGEIENMGLIQIEQLENDGWEWEK